MTREQKAQNTIFFERMIEHIKEGGYYFWPDENEKYVVKNGKFIAKKSALTKIKNITLPSFHSKLVKQ